MASATSASATTHRARELFVGAEAAGRTPEEFAGARVLAKLGHGDAAQRQRRRGRRAG